MGIREDALALADELEEFEDGDCEECSLYGKPECNGELPCAEAVAWHAARKIREAVERDGECATTVSAYDLLNEEDRKAIAWVREHDGLEAVEKRLMPEGMEWLLDVWPKWSNGEYCKFGDWWKARKYGELEPRQLSRLAFFTPEQLREWGQDEGENFGYEWDFMRPSDTTYRPDKVEPPAPKVLDADGVEIREGDVLYSVETGDYVIVDSIEPGNPWFAIADGALQHCAKFTHRAPVLDADGEPIREGDTVYVLGFGEPLTVKGFTDDGRVLMSFHGENSLGYKPSRLTHEQPDTWERVEEDCAKFCIEYCGERGLLDDACNTAEGDASTRHCTDCGESCEERMARDLVRRCRALVEKENRNE